MLSVFRRSLKSLLHFILPARCLGCREIIEEAALDTSSVTSSLCAACWSDLTFLSSACCDRCGIPFDIAPALSETLQADMTCGGCLQKPPPFAQAKSALLYDDQSKKMLLRFKHGDAQHMTPTFAAWLFRVGANMLKETDHLVPVPLHWTRLLKRQYNQAALLCHALGKVSSVPVLVEGLKRTERTKSQGFLTQEQRHLNVAGKFVVPAKNLSSVNKKVITLIDDVYTSGATVKACVKTLKKAGAKRVYVLTVARVARL